MKVVHVFPQFTPESINGSERYEYMLAAKLVEVGVEVDLMTTTTKDFLMLEPFSFGWPHQHTQSETDGGGIRIKRFPASHLLPQWVSGQISRQMLRRWKREERHYGVMLKGSRNLIDYYHRRAIERPRIYDLVTLGQGPYSARLLVSLVNNIRHYDAIQVGFIPFALAWQIVALGRMFRKPVAVLAFFHPDDISHHFRTIYWTFSAADAVLAQTVYSAALLKRLFPRCAPVNVGAGVDLDAFSDAKACGARFRGKYGLDGRRLVLFVGRKELFKRYDLAVRAIELIDDERVHLVMIGSDIDRHPITNRRVSYLGEVSQADLADAYDACDLFALPSENESFGMVFLEAWARRKPVIGNGFCRPVRCLIGDGEDGFLCSDASEIAAAITRLLRDPMLAQRLGEAGYRKVTTRYTWDAVATRVRDLYAQLAEKYSALSDS